MTTTRAAVVPGFARSSDGPRTSPAVAVERLRTNLRRDIRWVARGISESCAAVVAACRRRLARGVCGIFVRPPVILFRVFPVHCGIEGVVYRDSNRGVQLARLGMTATPEFRWGSRQARGVGFGDEDKAFLSSKARHPAADPCCVQQRDARERERVSREALAAGGRDNGAPALSPEHHADYFSAYVFDRAGHNI